MEDDDPKDVSQIQDSHETEPSETGNDSGLIFDWKERETKELVGSIIRRVDMNQQKPVKESRNKDKTIAKSISLDEKLAEIVPEFESLPLETQQGCSLDRNRMKQSLPFELLATMCPPMRSVCSSFPDDLTAAIGRSLESSPAIRLRGHRKMSAPALADFYALHKKDSNITGEDREGREDGEVKDGLGVNELELPEDKQHDAQREFRGRTQAIRLRDGERRHRRLTEPVLFKQNYLETDHL